MDVRTGTRCLLGVALVMMGCSESISPAETGYSVGETQRLAADADGGELTLGEASIQVAENRLEQTVEISLTRSMDPPPEALEAYTDVYHVGPAGLELTAGIELSIEFPADKAFASMYRLKDGNFEPMGATRRDGRVIVSLRESATLVVGRAPGCPGKGCEPLTTERVDKLDLLFMVDNSGSMREEQEALRREFPKLIATLASGDKDGDGNPDFPAVRDMHLGVVSSDMGLVGIQGIPGCDGLGDDGRLLAGPGDYADAGCDTSYPQFLTYSVGDDPDGAATDFGCVAMLGTEGCGFEQQLESTLKALWPSEGDDADEIVFLGDPTTGSGTRGQGDRTNAGFLRNDRSEGRSLIAVVVVTDEEDCSSADTSHFTPNVYLDPGDELAMQDLNLRCHYNKQNLYNAERYVSGLKALRADAPHLVVFAAIAGVPTDLVDAAALADFDYLNPEEREAYYDGILEDPRMQEVADPDRTPEQGGNVTPSCTTDTGRAFPPRRIVEVARGFGTTGVVQSICQDDFGPAIDVLIDCIELQLSR